MATDRRDSALGPEVEHHAPSRRQLLLAGGAFAGSVLATGGAAPALQPATASSGGVEAAVPPCPDAEEAAGITLRTLEEAEKLAGVEYTAGEREMILGSEPEGMVERFRARREVELPNTLAPAQRFDPRLPGTSPPVARPLVVPPVEPPPFPTSEEDVAFASLGTLAAWITAGEVSSRELTELSLRRLEEFGPALECVVTLTAERAMEEAARADEELAAGRWRGPLHGIPWGAKDLFDTAGIATTWGATPYRHRVPERDAVVVSRLREAGAVLTAKLTLGALAYGDIWFGGRTNNPFNLEQGSSGSSAGSAAATAAGLVGFALGTETLGSIVSPSMRCGTAGLRPTFGRVARTGAMALCWSLDKIGPLCRTAEDCLRVLAAIDGADPGDPASLDVPLAGDFATPADGLVLGYDPAWFEGDDEADVIERQALAAARAAGLKLEEIELPELPYQALRTILDAEAAAAFEELTLSDRDDELVWQEPRAWPNLFRKARFIPAVEYIQADRFRRQVMAMMAERMAGVAALLAPSYAGSLLLITNATGHPSLTLRAGFKEDGTPDGVTLYGQLFDEVRLCRIGRALERELGVWGRRPQLPAVPPVGDGR